MFSSVTFHIIGEVSEMLGVYHCSKPVFYSCQTLSIDNKTDNFSNPGPISFGCNLCAEHKWDISR